jgi:hypothetical protein
VQLDKVLHLDAWLLVDVFARPEELLLFIERLPFLGKFAVAFLLLLAQFLLLLQLFWGGFLILDILTFGWGRLSFATLGVGFGFLLLGELSEMDLGVLDFDALELHFVGVHGLCGVISLDLLLPYFWERKYTIDTKVQFG